MIWFFREWLLKCRLYFCKIPSSDRASLLFATFFEPSKTIPINPLSLLLTRTVDEWLPRIEPLATWAPLTERSKSPERRLILFPGQNCRTAKSALEFVVLQNFVEFLLARSPATQNYFSLSSGIIVYLFKTAESCSGKVGTRSALKYTKIITKPDTGALNILSVLHSRTIALAFH